MHLCLSCNQPCSLSSIFCDACRLSLLERREGEEAELISVGSREEQVNLASPPQRESGDPGLPAGQAEETVLRQTEGEYLWSWDTSNLYKVENLACANQTMHDSFALTPIAPPLKRPLPRRVRIALLIFLIVGALAFTVDGFLLFLSIMKHHAQPPFLAGTRTAANSTQLLLTPVDQTLTTPGSTVTTIRGAFSLSTFSLAFTATQGQLDPPSQSVLLSSGGQSGFSWQVGSSIPSWLHLSSSQGSAIVGANAALVVSVQTGQIAAGTYTTHLLIRASDGQGNILPGGTQTLNVTFTVLAPCMLQTTPTKLAFTANLLQSAPTAQMLTLTEKGDCTRPIIWQISSDASWITFSSTSGYDTGLGSTIIVQANKPNKLVGAFSATLTILAADSLQAVLADSPMTIAVTLTVTVV